DNSTRPINMLARTTNPKSAGTSSRASTIVLTTPIERSVRRIRTVHRAPFAMRLPRFECLTFTPKAGREKVAGEGRGSAECDGYHARVETNIIPGRLHASQSEQDRGPS